MSETERSKPVVVVGAGIVGLCTAYFLQKAGHAVTLVDSDEPGSQCSFGNAGALSEHSVAPLAMPGVLMTAGSMLLRPSSPLYVPMNYWLQAAPWLARFVASASRGTVERTANALHGLLRGSLANHLELAADVGCSPLIRHNGQLHVYPNTRALRADSYGWSLKRKYGLRTEPVGPHQIRELEPNILPCYTAGYFLPDEAWISDPHDYALAIATVLRRRGVRFVRSRIDQIKRAGDRWEAQGPGHSVKGAHVVIAAGAWSASLLEGLGHSVPLESQRGYHLQAHQEDSPITRMVVLADKKVFMTPTRQGLRMAGTVEFGGLHREMNHSRVAALLKHARGGIALPVREPRSLTSWMGHRPCLPDSLPVVGAVPDAPGIWCAFGHGHLGVTGSANTGRLLTQAIAGQGDDKKLAPLSVGRFGH